MIAQAAPTRRRETSESSTDSRTTRRRAKGTGAKGTGAKGTGAKGTGAKGVGARVAATLAGLAAAALLALAPAAAASAHDYLVSSTPAANATVTTALPSVALTFDDIVIDDGGHGALVQVTDASGHHFETGCAAVAGRTVTVPVALGAPGAYRITWQIVSADGHPVSNSIQFTYSGPKAGAGASGPIAKCGTTVSAPSATNGPTAAAAVSPAVIGILATAAGVVLLAVVAVVIVLVLSRRRRPE